MTTTYRLDANELSADLLKSIKAAFKGKTIEITVSEAMDETEYLLASPANKAHLEQSIKEIESGQSVVFTVDELQKKYGK